MGMSKPTDVFADPQAVARYAEGPPRLVPGFADLQRMATVLLAERAPRHARVLVVGAGGGLELKVFAESQPDWQFDGVDPSAEMLKLAEGTLGPLMPRVRLHQGYIDVAPEGPFDAATCLLTKAANARAAIDAQLPILTPEQDEATLRDSGFTNVSLFHVGLTFRGWVAYESMVGAAA